MEVWPVEAMSEQFRGCCNTWVTMLNMHQGEEVGDQRPWDSKSMPLVLTDCPEQLLVIHEVLGSHLCAVGFVAVPEQSCSYRVQCRVLALFVHQLGHVCQHLDTAVHR